MTRQGGRTGRPASGWQLAPLLTSGGLVALLVGTWLCPATRTSWNELDLIVFRGLNGTLAKGAAWQWLWAAANSRLWDLLSGAAVLLILWVAFHEPPELGVRRGCASLGVLLAALLLTRYLAGDLLIERCLEYQRPSPTQTLENCHRLSQLVPSIHSKDSSPWSFPGDHGFVLLTIAIYASYWARSATVRSCWGLVILCGLPRLVSGAHWFTDLAIGSLCMALVTTALLMATPLHDRMAGYLEHLLPSVAEGRTRHLGACREA